MKRRNKKGNRTNAKNDGSETGKLSEMERQNGDLLDFIKNYKEEDQKKDVLSLEAAKIFARPSQPISFEDEVYTKFLRSLKKISPKKKLTLENHLRAISFFRHHDPKLEQLNDSMLSNLRSLLLKQFNRGVTHGKRLLTQSAKKRRK